jgi:hypothetical protein
MIITTDERLKTIQRGEPTAGVSAADVPALKDAADALNAASTLEDTLYVGLRTIRVIVNRRRRYFVDVGSSHWITFEWRVHDAINVRLVRLRRTTLGSAFKR